MHILGLLAELANNKIDSPDIQAACRACSTGSTGSTGPSAGHQP